MLNCKILILSIFILTHMYFLPSDPATLPSSSPKHTKKVSFTDFNNPIEKETLQNTQSKNSVSKRTAVHCSDGDDDDQLLSIATQSIRTIPSPTSSRVIELTDDELCHESKTTATKTTLYTSSSSSENELDSINQKIKLGGIITLSAVAAAGSIQLKQYLEKDDTAPVRRSLLEAGDIFGAGRTAEGAGAIVKGIALAIAAGGVIYTVRKYFGLIDARFDAQEEKHKTMTELKLRKNNEEWETRVREAFEEQQKITREFNTDWAKRLLLRADQERDGMLKILRPLMSSIQNINHAVQQEKERNHKRIEPLVEGLAYITQILQERRNSLPTTSEKLQALQQNAEKAAMLNKASNSSLGTETGINASLEEATNALNSQTLKVPTAVELPAQAPAIKIDPPKTQEKAFCCCW